MKSTTNALLLTAVVLFAGCRYDVIETKQGAIVKLECDHPRADEYPWPSQGELEHAFDYMIESLPRYVPTTKHAVKWTISHAEITLRCNPFPCFAGMCAGLAHGSVYQVYWQGAVYNSAVLHEFLHTIIVIDTGHGDSDHRDNHYWDAVYPWAEEYRSVFFARFGYYAPMVIWDDWQVQDENL